MAFTPEQWSVVKALFEAALEQPPGERSGFLRRACSDPEVFHEVDRLLAHSDEAGSFLSQPAVAAYALAPAHDDPPTFAPGAVLAGRFRVIELLARGGMGEVYEAEDLELREAVALKTVRPDLLRDPRVLERFRREVHLAKKVTHPNVCRTFDLFRHGDADSNSGILLVSMELLLGETLAQRLQRTERMSTQEALPIALQMGAGLGAAHEAGVLHRDFKPGNVMLVPGARGMRAVITDFGLALRSSNESSRFSMLTGTGESFGTPAYMSPEQVEGKELTPASDVYALGLVLYYMVTGVRAFQNDSPLSTAVRRLKEDPTPPRSVLPDLDERWNQVILRCLARRPENRFASASEVAAALKGETSALLSPRRIGGRKLLLASIVMFLCAAVVLGGAHWLRSRRLQTTATEAAVVARSSVAVLQFKNLSGRSQANWVSTALGEMLTSELAAGEKLRTIPGEEVVNATAGMAPMGSEALALDTLKRLHQALGTDYVVLGSYFDLGTSTEAQLRFDLRLQNTSSGNTLASVSEQGTESQLAELVTRAGARLRAKLGMPAVTSTEVADAKAAMPSSPQATRLYSEGLTRLRLFDALSARELLEKAAHADPGSALIHSGLSEAWGALGYDAKAQTEATTAYQLSGNLPREQRLSIEGRNWAAQKNWDKAAQSYRSLFDFFPDNVDYGLRLADALTRGGKGADALAVLSLLRKLPSPARDDPRIELEEATAQASLGNFQKQQAAAEQAAAKARSLGGQLLLARALNEEATSYGDRGQWKECNIAAARARELYSAGGDRQGVSRTLLLAGNVSYKQGNFADAIKNYREGLRIDQEIGNDGGAATAMSDLANALWDSGDWQGSQSMYEQAIALFRKVGDKYGYESVLINLAGIYLDRGDLAAARANFSESLRLSRVIGDKVGEGTSLVNIGDVRVNQGRWVEARKAYESALALFRSAGDQSSTAWAMDGLGQMFMLQGDLAAAQQQFKAALRLRQQSGEQAAVANTEMELAEVFLERGEPAVNLEQGVRQLAQQFRLMNNPEGQVDAAVLLSRILLAQHKIAEAQSVIASVQDVLHKTENFTKHTTLDIATARVQAAAAHAADARRILQETITRTRQLGFVGLELEAREALGMAEVLDGRAAAGATRLAAVQQDARARGYGLIASRAGADNPPLSN